MLGATSPAVCTPSSQMGGPTHRRWPSAPRCTEATALQNALGSVADHDTWAMLIEIVSPHEGSKGHCMSWMCPLRACGMFGKAYQSKAPTLLCYIPHLSPCKADSLQSVHRQLEGPGGRNAGAGDHPANARSLLGRGTDASFNVVFGLGSCSQETPQDSHACLQNPDRGLHLTQCLTQLFQANTAILSKEHLR